MFEATFANNVPSKSLKKVSLPSRLTVVKLRSKRGVSPQPVWLQRVNLDESSRAMALARQWLWLVVVKGRAKGAETKPRQPFCSASIARLSIRNPDLQTPSDSSPPSCSVRHFRYQIEAMEIEFRHGSRDFSLSPLRFRWIVQYEGNYIWFSVSNESIAHNIVAVESSARL
jgi:hypothetical protein